MFLLQENCAGKRSVTLSIPKPVNLILKETVAFLCTVEGMIVAFPEPSPLVLNGLISMGLEEFWGFAFAAVFSKKSVALLPVSNALPRASGPVAVAELFRSNDLPSDETLLGVKRVPFPESVVLASQANASRIVAPSRNCTHDRTPLLERFLLDGKGTSAPATPPSPIRKKPYALMVLPDSETCHSAAFVPGGVLPETRATLAPKVTSYENGLYNSTNSPVLNWLDDPFIGEISLSIMCEADCAFKR